ncbi:uncharacterized protein LOC143034115 [Oratosquilla oratoria]|uniref:uncharacterized protein LOC143034115 n=1 Tax=Oratosquilla oratoria TaxID=337810 RepID=UPI003F7759C8
MGPLCFLILIIDALMDTPHRWKYMEDSIVDIPINTRRPDYAPLQNTLNKLMTWTEDNNVTINTNKTVVMHFCTSTQAVAPPQLSLGLHPLQLVQSTKILGITLDDHLNWNQHVTSMVWTASYKLNMLRRLKTLGTSTSELQEVYKTFVLPTLMYASSAWSSSLILTQRQKLERVQKRACKIILGVEYSGYDPAITTLTLSRVSQRHNEAVKKFGKSLLSHPRYLHFLPPDIPPPRHATTHRNRFVPVKAPSTNRYKISVYPSIVHIINSM